MKIQIIKAGTVKTKKQGMACDILVDEPPMAKK
jgi:hypothetical protein